MTDLFRPTTIVTGTRRVPVRPPRTVRPPTEAGPITVGENCATFTDSNVQTFTWPIPSDAKTGDLCFQFIHTYNFSISTVPSGWTQGWAVNANTSNVYGYMYYKVLEAADLAGGLTFDLDVTGEAAALSWFVRGDSISFADVTVSGPVGMDTAEHDPPAVTPTQGDGDYYVLVVFQENFGDFTTSFAASGPTGYDAKCEITTASPKVHVWQATKSIVGSENPSEIAWTDAAGSRKYATATIAIPVTEADADVATGGHVHAVDDLSDVDTTTAAPATGDLLEWDGSNWVPTDQGLTTKGDLLVHDGTDYKRIAVGANDQVLTADSAQTLGVKWAAGGAGSGAWTQLATVDLTSAGLITFSSIASGYNHLIVKGRVRTTNAASIDAVAVRVGSTSVDSGSNYSYLQSLVGSTSTTTQSASAGFARIANVPGAGADAGKFGLFTLEIRYYTDTAISRLMWGEGTMRSKSTEYIISTAQASWNNTANAIDIISFGGVLGSFGNLAADSRAELWGLT